MTFASVFKETVREYQPMMEELVGAQFGEIIVRPLDFLKDNWFHNLRARIMMSDSVDNNIYASAGNENDDRTGRYVIKYNPCRVLNRRPDEYVRLIVAHELGHIGYYSRVTIETRISTSSDWSEAIADYLAVAVFGDPKLPYYGDRLKLSCDAVETRLQKRELSLIEALPMLGLEETL